ncbi:hypothetical protein N1851_020395 [Merluccius polli]|uniref:Uncharacterized protein n=1 Tax=Merluccius polli TaxID=89951 RepID=A0AA47MKU1_MERPO|nr:hypothetical protein N1851_020395 [Merluccius polli]
MRPGGNPNHDSRAPSTRALANRWKIFCGVVLAKSLCWKRSSLLLGLCGCNFGQTLELETVRVDNQTHTLVTRFFKGAQGRNLPRAVMVPSWDLPLVTEALLLPPFEPLEQSGLTMASAKRVSELHALSVSEACMRWNSDGTGVALWPNPAFSQKAYDPSFLQDEKANSVELLCPVRALRHDIQATAGFHHCDSLFVCYVGLPPTKDFLSRILVAISS